jgi:uroporphyrinogen-III synthase
MFFSPSAVESYLTNNKIKNEICFCVGNTTAKSLELNKVKNIVIAEIPTIEDVIIEVIAYYNTEESTEPLDKI